ncbi:uncharacterized protein B0I36DRAFT_8011 [Microdochium trichocladiopsis]|uniref:Uncharacterized protein n=1 Tax=Microdochium trichocladiopsis TaxID=1682393 RepID=A0A9P8YH41_9PEZI|nr:uncharacterized protein B0I36DRAFT_8011 [Microdochium trichocladiopsis]KAH7040279.1 hypothetical protein B0I36DRAFT_8011 [Microdochium trichocladiopsis]
MSNHGPYISREDTAGENDSMIARSMPPCRKRGNAIGCPSRWGKEWRDLAMAGTPDSRRAAWPDPARSTLRLGDDATTALLNGKADDLTAASMRACSTENPSPACLGPDAAVDNPLVRKSCLTTHSQRAMFAKRRAEISIF